MPRTQKGWDNWVSPRLILIFSRPLDLKNLWIHTSAAQPRSYSRFNDSIACATVAHEEAITSLYSQGRRLVRHSSPLVSWDLCSKRTGSYTLGTKTQCVTLCYDFLLGSSEERREKSETILAVLMSWRFRKDMRTLLEQAHLPEHLPRLEDLLRSSNLMW